MTEYMVGPRSSLADGTRCVIGAEGVEVGVFQFRDQIYAFENRCLHQGGPVCEGLIIGRERRVIDDCGRDVGGSVDDDEMHLICPWHGWEYRLSDGRCAALPDVKLQSYDVELRGEDVYIII